MRVVRSHTSRAFDAMRRTRHRRRRPTRGRPGDGHASGLAATSPLTIDAALRIIDAQPPVRVALVDAASARLAAGTRPTAEQIADEAIRSALCDLSS